MGFWTWTDASVLKPRLNRYGDYVKQDMINYDGFAKVVCPDNSEIIEQCYQGYGIFDGKDVYELVVDWNRDYLEEIFDRIKNERGSVFSEKELRPIAIAYQSRNEKVLNETINAIKAPYLKTDWKRNIGIAIACETNEMIPYPIKITKKRRHIKYADLYPSISTQ